MPRTIDDIEEHGCSLGTADRAEIKRDIYGIRSFLRGTGVILGATTAIVLFLIGWALLDGRSTLASDIKRVEVAAQKETLRVGAAAVARVQEHAQEAVKIQDSILREQDRRFKVVEDICKVNRDLVMDLKLSAAQSGAIQASQAAVQQEILMIVRGMKKVDQIERANDADR